MRGFTSSAVADKLEGVIETTTWVEVLSNTTIRCREMLYDAKPSTSELVDTNIFVIIEEELAELVDPSK